MKPYYEAAGVVLYLGDCIEVMRGLPESSVDAIVTDPPYELGFMGKGWDATGIANSVEMWGEALRVLKPGGHLAAFGGTRTYHRMAVAIEDAGFEIRDSLMWLYGSGFPKSLDVSKAIDAQDAVAARLARARQFQRWLAPQMTPQRVNELTGTEMGHHLTTHPTQPEVATERLFAALRPHLTIIPTWIEEMVRERTIESENVKAREVVGHHADTSPGNNMRRGLSDGGFDQVGIITAAHTDAARQWEGWGTALKPAYEPIVLARKPLVGTVAANVLAHGTGALNIDATRIEAAGRPAREVAPLREDVVYTGGVLEGRLDGSLASSKAVGTTDVGRWPANVLLDEEAAAILDATVGELTSGKMMPTHTDAERNTFGQNAAGGYVTMETYGDRGGPSRFFYTAKASRSEREAGVEVDLVRRADSETRAEDAPGSNNPRLRVNERRNDHPTVKPVDLMRWLCRLVTPPGGLVLDPFNGSGTTGMAALDEGFRYIGIDLERRYLEIAQHRITHRHLLEVETKPSTPERPQGVLL